MNDHEAAQHARILALEASVNRLSSGEVLIACMRERDQLAEKCRDLRLQLAGKQERILALEGALKLEHAEVEWLMKERGR